jgi:BirA family biotin operon repressor/biotin-[acetyl-CoA-carboxylase] ligase
LTLAKLSPPKFESRLTTRWLGRRFEWLPSCTSTNDEIASLAATGTEEGYVIAADQQTSGRGRRGREWHSPTGENLYFSILLRPALPAMKVAPLTLLAGVALAKAMTGLGFTPRLKWPNDALLPTRDGLRKVSGMLTEMASEGERIRHIVLGVGINVNCTTFPDELAMRATSLCLVRQQSVERGEVLATFLNALEPIYDEFVASGPSSGLAEWRRFGLLGQTCWVERNADRIVGVAEDVDESGTLLMRIATGGLIPIYAGEVNWLPSR